MNEGNQPRSRAEPRAPRRAIGNVSACASNTQSEGSTSAHP